MHIVDDVVPQQLFLKVYSRVTHMVSVKIVKLLFYSTVVDCFL